MNYQYFFFPILVLAIVGPKCSRCDDDPCKRLKELDYELYGTKTMYETARRHLESAKDDDLPKSFGEDSLQEEHQKLLKDHCGPVAFYFVGRHSARFPDSEDIEIYNKQLLELKDKLKQLDAARKCHERLRPFLEWTPRMQSRHDNLITEIGAQEERGIARRFKRIYPEFFDTSKSDVRIGVTKKIRTAQTAVQFLKEVDGLSLESCDERSLPTNDLERADYSLDKILNAKCYAGLMDKHAVPFLEFHNLCEKIGGKQKVNEPLVERAKDPNVVRRIAERVSKRLGLSGDQNSGLVGADLLDSMFDVCKFENAFRNDSAWCNLFEKKDVQALEYIEDLSNYIKGAYGAGANVRQTCPLVKDLVERFEEASRLGGGAGEKRRAYFYFSHAGPMKKLMAAFNLFKDDDDDYGAKRVREFVDELKFDRRRQWRSSLIVPFSGNLAFVMYRCQKPGKEVKHRILATVSERPVRLGGCKDTDCKADRFFSTYGGAKDCDLSRICAKS